MFVISLRTRALSFAVARLTMKTSSWTRLETSLAAPLAACTIGMNTPSTSSVTSTVAIAANDGIGLRRIERMRLAEEEAEAHQSEVELDVVVAQIDRGRGAGSPRISAPNSAVVGVRRRSRPRSRRG